GEASGKVVLTFAQHVDGKMIRRKIGLEAQRAPAEAPQDERRLERHGIEGIGGITDKLAARAAGRDNRDAGCEGPQGVAKLSRIGGGRACVFLLRLFVCVSTSSLSRHA